MLVRRDMRLSPSRLESGVTAANSYGLGVTASSVLKEPLDRPITSLVSSIAGARSADERSIEQSNLEAQQPEV